MSGEDQDVRIARVTGELYAASPDYLMSEFQSAVGRALRADPSLTDDDLKAAALAALSS